MHFPFKFALYDTNLLVNNVNWLKSYLIINVAAYKIMKPPTQTHLNTALQNQSQVWTIRYGLT